MINNYYTYGETWQENNLGCRVFFCCFFKAAFLNLGHNNRSHSSQGKDAVFGIRANWTEQWCRMWISKINVAQTSFTPTHLNTILVSMYRLAWTFKRLKTCDFSFFLLSSFSFFLLFFFSFFIGKPVIFAPDLHRRTTYGNKTRTCYSKQIYFGVDTLRHVTHRWKYSDAINYLHY